MERKITHTPKTKKEWKEKRVDHYRLYNNQRFRKTTDVPTDRESSSITI